MAVKVPPRKVSSSGALFITAWAVCRLQAVVRGFNARTSLKAAKSNVDQEVIRMSEDKKVSAAVRKCGREQRDYTKEIDGQNRLLQVKLHEMEKKR